MRRAWHVRLLPLALPALVAVLVPGVSQAAAGPGYVSLLFGRTLWVSAISTNGGATCSPLPNAVTLGQAHDDLVARGLTATGIVIPSRTPQTGFSCFKAYALQTGWDRITAWHDEGWSFVSGGTHADVRTLDYEGSLAESCGFLGVFAAHGIDATGLFAYGDDSWTQTAQVDPVSRCFDWGRQYNSTAANTLATAAAPWFQKTQSVNGGLCNDSSLPCNRSVGPATTRYTSPDSLVAKVSAAPDTWYAVQFYRFVTGSYSSGSWSWDCRSASWRQHWTSQGELYCYNDFLRVADAIKTAVANGVIATDPATVAAAWGRVLHVPPPGTPRTTATSVSCVQAGAGAPASCTATVADIADGTPLPPDGRDSVVWSADQPGTFSATTCTPSGPRPSTTCRTVFVPEAGTDPVTVTAAYLGSSDHLPSSGTASVVGATRGTATTISCPTAGVEGIPFTCQATVTDVATGVAITPGGSDAISWSTDAAGTFSPTTCTPAGVGATASCTTSFTPAVGSAGTVDLGAAYAGDAFHLGSTSQIVSISVTSSPPPDTTPPSVSLTSPVDGATVPAGGFLTIRAGATDDDRVVDVRFYVAGTIRCTDAVSPYTCAWWPRKQTGVRITIEAIARDPAGNQASHLITVTTA